METLEKTVITVSATVNAPLKKVWENWNSPDAITQWGAASDDWHAPHAELDLREGGNFKTVMAAKDGSFSFDFGGVFTKVEHLKTIEYTIGDGRRVQIEFSEQGGKTLVTESFEAESQHPIEMQRGGWQAILDNFKKYTEEKA